MHTAGQRTNALVELIDLYPTLVDLCELPMPTHLEGKSLRPILKNPMATVKSSALTWHPRPAYPSAKDGPEAMGYSIRTQHFRYTEWRSFPHNKRLASELYDHRSDPHEMVNQASNATFSLELENHRRWVHDRIR